MRIFFHLTLILLIGVLLGLGVRKLRTPAVVEVPAVVYDNTEPFDADAEPVLASEPTAAPEGWMTDFVLTERSGQTVSSDDLQGQPYVVSFFFSTCPSICVQQNQKVQELQREFEGTGVRFVSISVDPETDTPEVLREYSARFAADPQQWLFMTGDLLYIRRVGAEVFRLAVDEKFHTEKLVLVDPQGAITGYYDWPEPRQFAQLKTDIRAMLSESAPGV